MDDESAELRVRTHGDRGPRVIALHGGPAAVGEAEPVARGLSKAFLVYEPFQRASGDTPLTVAVHVEDLRRLVARVTDEARPSLVGESWGAMLALAYAAALPDTVSALVLVGCGTFDAASRARMQEIVESRLDDESKRRLATLQGMARYELIEGTYNYDEIRTDGQLNLAEPFDERAHLETWGDMLRLQEDGTYPAAFSRIACPVLMIHGEYDPHPGRMIYDSLKPHIPQLEYQELAKCGHSPWKEKHARREFFMVMSNWLIVNCERP